MFTGHWLKPTYIVAEEHGKIIGFGGSSESWMDTSVAELFWINVVKNNQRNGAGKRIVAKIIRELKRKYRTILLSTTIPRFYAQFGFKSISPRAGERLCADEFKSQKIEKY